MTFTDASKQVQKFMRLTLNTYSAKPTYITIEDFRLCKNLIEEETLVELLPAIESGDMVEVLDAAADSLYVILFALNKYGIANKFEEAFTEVCRSNLTKLWSGKEVREANKNCVFTLGNIVTKVDRDKFVVKRKMDGKVVKSPSYSPANIKGILGL